MNIDQITGRRDTIIDQKELTKLRIDLRETQAKLSECRHALEHLLTCEGGTVLCKDCKRLCRAAYEGKHWVHFKDDTV